MHSSSISRGNGNNQIHSAPSQGIEYGRHNLCKRMVNAGFHTINKGGEKETETIMYQ